MDLLSGSINWTQGDVNQRRGLENNPKDPTSGLPIGQATVLYSDGKLILFNDVGELILARATPSAYEELARVRVLGGEICWTQPTLVRGRLYVRNHSRAACVLLSNPSDPHHPIEAPLLTVADIPQSAYRDWASWLLPIEPEYAMDAPTLPELTRWYGISLWGFGLAVVITTTGLVLRLMFRSWRKLPVNHRAWSGLFCGVIFCWGAWGTTFLSARLNEFLFTWPMCLFAVFSMTTYQVRGGNDIPHSAWRGRIWLGIFLLLCIGFYFLCLRLSLAFEWVYLAGFPAAVPLILLARRHSQSSRLPGWIQHLGEWGWLFLAYTAYFWASVALLIWKYSP